MDRITRPYDKYYYSPNLDSFYESIVQKYDETPKMEKINLLREDKNLMDKIEQKIEKKLDLKYKKTYPRFQFKAPVLYKDEETRIELNSVDSYLLLRSTPLENVVKNYIHLSKDIEFLDAVEETFEDMDKKYKFNNYKSIYSIRIQLYKKKYDYLYNYLMTTSNSISYYYYEFLKIKDGIFVNYLRTFFFPKLIEKNQNINKSLVMNLSNIERDLKQNMKKYLTKKLLNLFRMFELFISGSFVLNSIIEYTNPDFEWEPDDIDCYSNETQYPLILQYLNENSIYFNEQNGKGYHMRGIKRMIEIFNGDFKIQIIFVEDHPWRFICENYDFDSCMNFYRYDLNTFNIRHNSPQQIQKMNISHLYQFKIFDLKDNYSNYRASKTIERSIKYIKRGFIVENIFEFLHNLEKKCF